MGWQFAQFGNLVIVGSVPDASVRAPPDDFTFIGNEGGGDDEGEQIVGNAGVTLVL